MVIMAAQDNVNAYILPRMIICRDGERRCGTAARVESPASEDDARPAAAPDPSDGAGEEAVPLEQALSGLTLRGTAPPPGGAAGPGAVSPEASPAGPANAPTARAAAAHYHDPAGADVEEWHDLPPRCVGRVIGKGGEMIRDLQARSGCRIDVAQGRGAKVIAYRGRSREDVELAKHLVSLLCGGDRCDDARAGDRAAVVELPLGRAVAREIRVPREIVGKVIGRGGEMIRELQTASHARIQVDHSNDYPSGNDAAGARTTGVTVTGTEESVRRAEEMILFLSDNPGIDGHVLLRKNWGDAASFAKTCQQQQQQQGMARDAASVNAAGNPASSAYWTGEFGGQQGAVLPHALPANASAGYGNGTIGYDQQQQECISQSWSDPYHPIATPPPLKPGSIETDTIPCAKADIGLIIGKRGATINNLQRRTSCNIQIDQQESTIGITGRGRDGIELAKRLIREITETKCDSPQYGSAAEGQREASPGRQQQQQVLGYAENRQQGYLPPLTAYPNQQYGMVPQQLSYYGAQQQQQPMVMPYQLQGQDQPYPVSQLQAPSSHWMVATAADGRIYYYNTNTLESTWDVPDGMQ